MSSLPKVSIVIAHYNGKHFLPETLRSIERQTFRDWEVLIVDDGSAVDHRAALAGGERVRILEQQREGAGAATQRGIEASRGEYVAFLDQDDLYHPRKLEADVRLLDTDPSLDLAFCGYQLIDPQGREIGGTHLPGADRFSFRDLLLDYRIGPSATATVRRSALVAAGPVDPSLHRYYDLALFLRVASLRAANVAATSEGYVSYRRHPGQLSADTGEMRVEWERVLHGLAATNCGDPAAFAVAQSNMDRYFAFLEYEQGRFAAGAHHIQRAFRHAPRAALLDPRNYLVAAGCLGGLVLPTAFRRLAERVAGVGRLSP
jgi:glycosyltransferase involved in cell wall biosynthesis